MLNSSNSTGVNPGSGSPGATGVWASGATAPARGASGVTLNLYVEDVDARFQQAVDAGAEVVMPPADMFWGDRIYAVRDLEDHHWTFATAKQEPQLPPGA